METNSSDVRPNISIIVPVYNFEKALAKCLDSIFNQKFSGIFEVIAVEDASTDSSLQILKDYQNREPRLKIIEQEVNKSLAVARVTGMDASTGDYIMHVDQDDWLLPGALENLSKKCYETDADVLVFNYLIENCQGKRTLVDRIKKELIIIDKVQVQPLFLGTAWNKIVKKSVTENLIYGKTKINTAEDLLYATEILLKANRICLIPESYYVYFTNTESISFVTRPEIFINDIIIILQQIKLIIINYKGTSLFTNNILYYIEKHIYFAISRSAFLVKGGKIQSLELLNAFRLFPEMNKKRLKRLSLSIKNKYFSLILVFVRFGAKPVLGIVIKNLRKHF